MPAGKLRPRLAVARAAGSARVLRQCPTLAPRHDLEEQVVDATAVSGSSTPDGGERLDVAARPRCRPPQRQAPSTRAVDEGDGAGAGRIGLDQLVPARASAQKRTPVRSNSRSPVASTPRGPVAARGRVDRRVTRRCPTAATSTPAGVIDRRADQRSGRRAPSPSTGIAGVGAPLHRAEGAHGQGGIPEAAALDAGP